MQSGCSTGRMPVAALMTLFSSGVQGRGVSGWTLPDGNGGQQTMPTTVCGKENSWGRTSQQQKTYRCTFMATTEQKLAGRCFRGGSCYPTTMRLKRRMWPYFDCGLFEVWKYCRSEFSVRFEIQNPSADRLDEQQT